MTPSPDRPPLRPRSVSAPSGSVAIVELRLDHLILRSADPEATLAELSQRAGAPVLAPVQDVGPATASGLLRAGSVDLEVLRIGEDPPPRPAGYGLGLVADVPLSEVAARLRGLGLATSPAIRATAGEGETRRVWRAIQIQGLLPDPFPVPASSRRPDRRDRLAEAATGLVARVPALVRAASRRAGRSMVVVTEYAFDVQAWRATAGSGPDAVAVELGIAGHEAAWGRLPLAGPVRLGLHSDGPPGLRRVVLAGAAEPAFQLGDVAFAAAP